MSHVLTGAVARAPIGTNAPIEQPFAALADRRRPRGPNVLYVDVALDAAQIGAYAGTEETPDIDRLARSGVRFTAAGWHAGGRGPRVPEVLLEHGYDDGVFGVASRVDVDGAVDAAVSFIGFGRPVPWAAYVHLGAASPARTDAAVGCLTHAVRRAGAYRRTVFALAGTASHSESCAPVIMTWPGQIPPRQRHDAPVEVADLVPTLVETARPGAARWHVGDGVDLAAHLFDGAPIPDRPTALRGVA